MRLLIIILTCLALLTTAPVLATLPPSAQPPEQLLGVGAGIRPDHPLYGLDRALERLQLALTWDPVSRASLRYALAQERLAEASELAEANQTELAQASETEYEAELAATAAESERAAALGRNITALTEHIANQTYRHIAVLRRVRERVPEVARPAIEAALERSLARHAELVGRIENITFVNVTITVDNRTVTAQMPPWAAERLVERAAWMGERLEKVRAELCGRAAEQIGDANNSLAELRAALPANASRAVLVLESRSAEHFGRAKAALADGRCGHALGQAMAAERLAAAALRMLEAGERAEAIEETAISEIVQQTNLTGEKISEIIRRHRPRPR